MARTQKNAQPLTTAQRLSSIVKSCRDIMRKDKGLNGDLDRLPMLTWIMFLKFLDDMEQIAEQEARMAGKRFRPALESPYRWRDWAAKADGVTGDELISFVNNEEAIRPDGTKGPGLFAYLRGLQGANGGDRRDVIATVFKGTINRMINGYLLRDVINKVSDIHFTSSDEIHTLGHLYESMLKETRDAAGDSGEFYTPRAVVRFIVEVMNPKLGEVILDPACGTGGFLVESFKHLEKQCQTVEDRQVLQTQSIFGGEAKSLPYLLAQMNLVLHGLESPKIDPLNSLRFPLREIGDRDRVDIIMTNPPFGGEEERGILGNFPEDKQTSETALLFLQLIIRKLKRAPKAGRAAVVVPESVMSDQGVAAKIRAELIEDFNLHTIVRLPKGVFEPYSDIQSNLLFFDRTAGTTGTWYVEHEVPVDRQSMQNPCYTQSIPLRFEELEPILEWWTKREPTRQAWYVPKQTIIEARYSFDFRNPLKRQAKTATVEEITSNLEEPLKNAAQIVTSLKHSSLPLAGLNSVSWERIPFKGFLIPVRIEAEIIDTTIYKQVTVRLYGKGAILRKTLPGSEIRTRPQFVARSGQLIMSRIDARNGAFAIVPPELDGAVVTQDFPLFQVDGTVIEPEFLSVLLRSHEFLDACKRASRGTTNRKRLKETILLDEMVPLPNQQIQCSLIELTRQLESLDKVVNSLQLAASNAIPAIANSIFG